MNVTIRWQHRHSAVMMLAVALLFLSTLRGLDAFSNGNVEVACDSMAPQHGVGAQNTPAPYIITGAQNADGSINVKLDSTPAGDGIFEGFLLQARDPSGRRVGAFSNQPALAQLLNCDFPGGAVAHNSNTKQKSIDVLWQPQGYTGDVQFRATVVRSFSTFWTGVTSQNFAAQPQQNNPSPPAPFQPPIQTQPNPQPQPQPTQPPGLYQPPTQPQPPIQPQPPGGGYLPPTQPQIPGGGYQPPTQPQIPGGGYQPPTQPQIPGGGYQPPTQPQPPIQPQPPGGGYLPPTQPQIPGGGYQPPTQPQIPGGGYQPPTQPQIPGGGYQPPTQPQIPGGGYQPPFVSPPNPSPGFPQPPNQGYLPPFG